MKELEKAGEALCKREEKLQPVKVMAMRLWNLERSMKTWSFWMQILQTRRKQGHF